MPTPEENEIRRLAAQQHGGQYQEDPPPDPPGSRRDDRGNLIADERDDYRDPRAPGYGHRPDDPGDADHDLEGIPLLGWLTGADSRMDEYRALQEKYRQEAIWNDLMRSAPRADALTPDYAQEGTVDEYGNLIGDPSQMETLGDSRERGAQWRALEEMQGLVDSGGYTSADAAMQNASRLSRGAGMRQANQAAIQQAQARGMGGGGQELLARMGGAQGANTANAMADAQLQQAAMQRALAAMQLQGQQSSNMYDQEAQRRGALDSFNQANNDWRRGRSTRNTQWTNRGEDARTQAIKDSYGMRERAVAGMTNQYSPDAEGARNRQQQANQDLGSGIGTIISEIL